MPGLTVCLGPDTLGAIRTGLHHESPAVREGPDPQVRMRAAELVGKFAHTDARAVAALQTTRAEDPSPAVRKKAGWYAPGGSIYERTA